MTKPDRPLYKTEGKIRQCFQQSQPRQAHPQHLLPNPKFQTPHKIHQLIFNCDCESPIPDPESWRETLIISIPKPGKDHFNPLNYRLIALTSCICKTVERMVNECCLAFKKRMAYWPDSNVIIEQIDRLVII